MPDPTINAYRTFVLYLVGSALRYPALIVRETDQDVEVFLPVLHRTQSDS